jgi:hypothetical protein
MDVLHFTLAVQGVDTAGWKLDSGATQHIVNVTSFFTSFVSYGTPKVLQVGKAEVFLRAIGEGTVLLKIPPRPAEGVYATPGDFTELILTKVWLCPECPFRLLSTRRIVENGNTIKLDNKGATILRPDNTPAIWMPLEKTGLYTCRPLEPALETAGAVVDAAGITLPHAEHTLTCMTYA